ncbi:MAG: GntR family transcriptional regulator [Desulfobacterales bacterium]|nr:GntR family transcriptional regulator [Desulfobacterales bacterium]
MVPTNCMPAWHTATESRSRRTERNTRMNAPPLQQRRLSDDIVERIETLILEGTPKPGEKLPAERALAEEFGVSRPSLREALQKLAVRGLLVSRQGGGTFISAEIGSSFRDPLLALLENNPEAQRDLLEFRHTLEGSCAYYAALRATEPDRERLTAAFDRVMDCHARPPGRVTRAEEGAGRRTLPPRHRRGQPQRRAAAHHPQPVPVARAQRGDQHRRHVSARQRRARRADGPAPRTLPGDHGRPRRRCARAVEPAPALRAGRAGRSTGTRLRRAERASRRRDCRPEGGTAGGSDTETRPAAPCQAETTRDRSRYQRRGGSLPDCGAQGVERLLPCAAPSGSRPSSACTALSASARTAADHAIRFADVVAARDQQRLQLAPLGARQARIVGRPGRREWPAAAQPVRQVGDRQAVALGRVVASTAHRSCAATRNAGPSRTRRQRAGRPASSPHGSQRRAIDAASRRAPPTADIGCLLRRPRVRSVDTRPAGAPRSPTAARCVQPAVLQKVRGRRQRVGHASSTRSRRPSPSKSTASAHRRSRA